MAISNRPNYKFFRGLVLFVAGVAAFVVLVAMIAVTPALVAYGVFYG